MLVTVLLGVVIPIGCAVACGLIGRHYERMCAEHRLYCEDIEGQAYALVARVEHEHAVRDAPTEVLPRIHPRAEGRHRLADR